ncbi:hypothetical protein ACQP2Y_24810 [Actinoplanes sp. CA-051413]|uniref:hypothetical protein n=1 Tax=Actinoplanes sp. CA-051413 TaxID=3239899 RepID=UPI003D99D87A
MENIEWLRPARGVTYDVLVGGPAATRGLRDFADDVAGTGGGSANPDFVARIEAGDRSAAARTSPLSVLRSAYVADLASLGDDEELLLTSMLSTAVGEDNREIVYDNCGHSPHIERPAEFLKLVNS